MNVLKSRTILHLYRLSALSRQASNDLLGIFSGNSRLCASYGSVH
ncbi:hypothetical protein [Noviherbaspirillum denitrificans]|nr:hypothetical protein [Noviherbaspirillum denitrificans]